MSLWNILNNSLRISDKYMNKKYSSCCIFIQDDMFQGHHQTKKYNDFSEVVNWCEENCTNYWAVDRKFLDIASFYFKSNEDKILFCLTFNC